MNPNEKGLIELLRGLEEDGFRGNLGGAMRRRRRAEEADGWAEEGGVRKRGETGEETNRSGMREINRGFIE